MRTKNKYSGFVGVPVDEYGREVEVPEEEHFYLCSTCGQAVDMRDLGQVFHHEERGHKKLDMDS